MNGCFDEEKLRNHPAVAYVTRYRLTLRYDFRIKLYKAWKAEQNAAGIHRLLLEQGLTEDLVGHDYCTVLEKSFKVGGFPIPHYPDHSEKNDLLLEENPLTLSGKFVRSSQGHGNGVVIKNDFLIEIEQRFPEISIEESLRMAGLDPLDVGYSRIRHIRKEIKKIQERKDRDKLREFMQQPLYPELKAEKPTVVKGKEEGVPEVPGTVLLKTNPYIETADYSGIRLNNAFYNEAYLLYPLGLEQIFAIFEIPLQDIPERSRVMISTRLYSWTPREEIMPEDSEQIRRIRKAKIKAMNFIIKNQFLALGKGFARMDIKHKRQFCLYLQDLPRDMSGYYTCARIRELTGIPKSTYYAVLNDENYGKSAEKRIFSDTEDIKVIREVLAYKGFEKGIRQVYMLMPKVTGQSFSIYRIRRLMNKYGIRTTIRRPSKNRKAVRELIARNKKANLLMRQFRLHRPNEVRLTDVTYLDYGDGKRAYGSASVDPVTGRLVCFIVSKNNDLQLALDTLEAMDAYPAKSGAILHSDQGSLYMTDDFQAAVVEKELNQSMSRRGNCWDNAPQESFFGHFKDECHYQECITIEELRTMIGSYALYYNTERGMWDKERMTPEEYENYLEAMDETKWKEHLAGEEERYLKMKEESTAKAVENARQYRVEIQERLEELKDETCEKRR